MRKFFIIFFQKICNLKIRCAYIKTQIFYKIIFKKIGKKTILFRPLKIVNPENIEIEENVYIYKGLRIEAIKEWDTKKYIPLIKIKSNVSIEQNCHITCANEVIIEKGVNILANVMITDINHIYFNINKPVLKQGIEYKNVKIGKNSFIGMGAMILPGTVLGENCIVGANAVVKGIYPSGCVLAGVPAKIIKKYDYLKKEWRQV